MQPFKHTSRGLRRRSDKWEATLSHKDPVTGETIRTYHTLEANTQRQAERHRDALILELERKGGAVAGAMTLREFMELFALQGSIRHHRAPTVRSYRGESSQLTRYLSNIPVASLTVANVNPEAKRTAVSKVENSFDFGSGGIGDASFLDAQDALLGANAQIASPGAAAAAPVPVVTFTVKQLEAMLAAAKGQKMRNA